MKRRNGIIAVALALVISGASAVGANAAEPAPAGTAATADDAVKFTSPQPYAHVDDKNPRFSGTGKAGASVVVTDRAGVVLCAARVTADGWSCTSVVDMGDGPTVAVATQDAWAVKTTDSVTFGVLHVDKPAVPLWVFAVGGAVVLLLVAAASILLVSRNRRNRKPGHGDLETASDPQRTPASVA